MTRTTESLSSDARDVYDNAACGLLLTESDGRILRANHAFCSWLGYSEEELVAQRYQELLTMGARIFHQTHWAPLLEMQGSISEVRLQLKHRDGHSIPTLTNAICRRLGDRNVHELAVFIARDRDKFEQELIQSQKRLQTLVEETKLLQRESRDRALLAEQMMGIVSHDLRNPLSTILMGTEALSEEFESSHGRVLGQIRRATMRANRLISDLLDFTQARLGAGLSVTRLPIDLHAVIAESVDELSLAFPERRLVHEAQGDATCSADPDRLSQLVGNLVGNAMTYGSPDSPVTVRSYVEAERVHVAVHNHGAAIPPERQGDIFAPMKRGSHASDEQRSVGLGLFIVSEIAEAHEGSVTIVSLETEGTTFTLSFPRHHR